MPSRFSQEQCLCGLENEVALGVRKSALRPRLPDIAASFPAAVQRFVPALAYKGKAPGPQGVMLGNGGRFYLDGQYFLEYATPEVLTPQDALVWQRAGELLLLKALPQVARSVGITPDDIVLTKAVTDYDGKYCGAHQNILLRRHDMKALMPHVIPFLVTRFYACCGGVGPSGFHMTQKARSIRSVASLDTREDRGIINLKDESLSGIEFHRAHITLGDACMTDWGTYLTLGCTMVVFKMLDDGASVGLGMTLEDPVEAVNRLDTDLTWSSPLRLACGLETNGIAIQEHYLRAAETYVCRACPSWMQEVVIRWRQALERLKRGLHTLIGVLDAPTKMRVFLQILHADGMKPHAFSRWCGVMAILHSHLGRESMRQIRRQDELRELLPHVAYFLVQERVAANALSWREFPRALRLWKQLIAVDLHFHDISRHGLYWRLRESGAVNSSLIRQEDAERAIIAPPKGTRARVRGEAIATLAGAEKGGANWQMVQSQLRHMLIPDPFAEDVKWRENNRKAVQKGQQHVRP